MNTISIDTTTLVFIINNMTYCKSLISLSLSELSAKKIKEQQTKYKVQICYLSNQQITNK